MGKQSAVRVPVQPTLDNVLIEPIVEEKSLGGIYLPESKDQMKLGSKGRVVAKGPGKYESGKFVETTVEVGARVYYHTYPSGVAVEEGGKKMVLISERQVVGVVNG